MGIQLYILTSTVFKKCLSVFHQMVIGYGMSILHISLFPILLEHEVGAPSSCLGKCQTTAKLLVSGTLAEADPEGAKGARAPVRF